MPHDTSVRKSNANASDGPIIDPADEVWGNSSEEDVKPVKKEHKNDDLRQGI